MHVIVVFALLYTSFTESYVTRTLQPPKASSNRYILRPYQVLNAEEGGGVYVLKLEDDCFYIGKTYRPMGQRLGEHFARASRTAWTRLHPPLSTIQPMTYLPGDLESWERAETLERMWQHGVMKVRGWQYTSLNLTASDMLSIATQLCERKDLCRRCGSGGHMFAQCKAKYKRAKWMTQIFVSNEYKPPKSSAIRSSSSSSSSSSSFPLNSSDLIGSRMTEQRAVGINMPALSNLSRLLSSPAQIFHLAASIW